MDRSLKDIDDGRGFEIPASGSSGVSGDTGFHGSDTPFPRRRLVPSPLAFQQRAAPDCPQASWRFFARALVIKS